MIPPWPSPSGGESGSADTARDPRGFAVKFYTDEGIWDLTGNNTPIFFIRDPLFFPSFIHTQKRNPQTHLKDANMFWDFISLRPETSHQVINVFWSEYNIKVASFPSPPPSLSLSPLSPSLSLSLPLSPSLLFACATGVLPLWRSRHS